MLIVRTTACSVLMYYSKIIFFPCVACICNDSWKVPGHWLFVSLMFFLMYYYSLINFCRFYVCEMSPKRTLYVHCLSHFFSSCYIFVRWDLENLGYWMFLTPCIILQQSFSSMLILIVILLMFFSLYVLFLNNPFLICFKCVWCVEGPRILIVCATFFCPHASFINNIFLINIFLQVACVCDESSDVLRC